MGNQWIMYRQPRPKARLRLFCLPYAGGNASVFREWWQHLPRTVDVCPVELPGHGVRMAEEGYQYLPKLVGVLADGLGPYMDIPFAFFGHSMGALLSFELSRYLRRHDEPQPAHLFVSSHRAPQIPHPDPTMHTLPRDEFVERLTHLGGMPEGVLNQPDLLELMLPIIRADFAMCDTYEYSRETALACSISAFGGMEDPSVTRDQLGAWSEQTTSSFMLRMLPGSHFFINTSQSLFLGILAHELRHAMGKEV